ncbi:Ribosomal protein S20 [Rickettsiales bacterium Ac37b]|nr:Ribosomal protein S20 [Rickettsiales bacterium Ac37b]
MPNHQSAKKAMRHSEKRIKINRARKSKIHTFIKKVETAITDGNKDVAHDLFIKAQSEIMRGVTKGILSLNTASRRISKLSKQVKAIA